MTINPVITVNQVPGVTATTGIPGLDYAAILSSMGVFVYDIKEIFYQCETGSQFQNPIQYSIYDANGNIKNQQIVTPISPIQYQFSMYLKTNDVILDGQSGFNLNIDPFELIRFIFYGNRKSNEMYLDADRLVNNFRETEKAMGIIGFFDDKNEDTDAS